MTAENITYFDTPDELKAHLRESALAWDSTGNGFEITVAPIEAWAREQLTAHEIKDAKQNRRDSLPVRVRTYAARVLRLIQIVRNAIAESNAQEAARFAITIGELFARIQMTVEWEQFALRGKKIAEIKRGPSRLYREAIAVLKENGADFPAKRVRLKLEEAGVIDGRSNVLRWKDDRGVSQTTTPKQFASNLSRLRKQVG